MRLLLLLCSLTVGFLLGCTNKSSEPPDPKSALIARGKSVYQTNCIACHNSNPKLMGALGPEIANSSLELLEDRVLRVEYPKDYKPKRTTHVMQPLPQLKEDIPALSAYLNSL
jgi:mono/diheme cytochrome c family protein